MKKNLLAILLALVLCFSLVAAVACTPEEEEPDKSDVTIPVAEGKLTLYWDITSESVELPSYASYWFIGSPVSWKTTPSTATEDGVGCLEAKKVEGSDNTWYVQIDTTLLVAENTYKVVMGYSSTATDVPDAMKGVIWNPAKNHSIEAVEEGSDLKLPYAEGDTKYKGIDLTFETVLGEYVPPAPLEKVDLRVAFQTALPSTAAVYIIGNFAGDELDESINGTGKATLFQTTSDSDARKDRVWQITVQGVKTMTEYSYTIYVINDASNLDAEKKVSEQTGVIKVVYAGQAMNIEFTSGDDGSYRALANTSPNSKADAFAGLDMSKADGGKLEIAPVVSATFSITFSQAIRSDWTVYIVGSMTGWSGTAMTASADRKTWTWTTDIIPGEYEFKIVIRDGFDWSGGVQLGNDELTVRDYADETITTDPGNAHMTVPVTGGTIVLWGQDVVTLPAPGTAYATEE